MGKVTDVFRIGGTPIVLLSLSNVDMNLLLPDKKIKFNDNTSYVIDSIPMVRRAYGSALSNDIEVGIECPLDFDEISFIGKEIDII